MHELSITENMLKIALQQAEAHQAKQITAINLKVGEWSSVVPDCVQFYFEQISQGTKAEGAKLNIETIPLQAQCSDCQAAFPPNDESFVCPKCGSKNTSISSGQELYVDSIEVEK